MKQNINLRGTQRFLENYRVKTITRIYILLLVCLFFLFTLVPGSRAATIYVSSYGDGTCSLTNVRSAYNTASTGDTIMFPASCSSTWSDGLTVGKAVTIDGNGTTLTANGTFTNGMFNITGFTADSLVRITGFTFNLTGAKQGILVNAMTGGVSVGQIRIDHNKFYYGSNHINFYHGKGLIDNNYFTDAAGITVEIENGGTDSWMSLTPGTADAVFVEDNHFIHITMDGQECIGTANGGKLVIRYNDFDGDNLNTGGGIGPIMTHGNQGGYYWESSNANATRGNSITEVYNNTFHAKKFSMLMTFRSGSNLIYNNSITGTATGTYDIVYREEEFTSDPSDLFPVKRTTWPAEDQVHNSFTWNNTYNGHDFNNGVYGSVYGAYSTCDAYPASCTNMLQKDRDYFLHAPCGAADSTDAYGNTCTHGKASFTGQNGASGSYPTNGSKYPTKGTMIFTPTGDNAYYGYTPYTYPHPLRSVTNTDENTQVFPPTIAVSPATKDFGSLPINTSSPAQRFTVTTTGGNLNVDAISMTGTNANQFIIQNDSCTGKIIAPATGSCTFDVKFSPSSVGAKTANISIVDNDTNTSKLITVNGTGTGQVPAMSFSPTSLSFTGVLVGTLPSKTVTLSNTGASFVSISSIILSGTNANQFSIPAATDHCTGDTVAPSGNCTFQIVFSPTTGGEKTANVNLTAQYYGSPATLPLYGSATVYQPRIKISRNK